MKYLIISFILLYIVKNNISYKFSKMFIKPKMSYLSDLLPYKVTNNIIPDILISPGGRYGTYQLGICHYIKNNFDIKNKKILGFSAGSWNTLFMAIDKKYDNKCLNELFQIKTKKITGIMKNTKMIIEKYNITDFDAENIYIASSTLNGLIIYNDFLTIQDLTRCCIASSFIPYLTYNDIFYFYKNRLSLDGGIYCKKYIKTLPSSTLVISFKMFGRYQNMNIFKEIIKKNKPSNYNLYINGYHDARKNHSYFEKYFS